MPIAGTVADGLYGAGSAAAFKVLDEIGLNPAPALPFSLGILSSYGFDEILVYWRKKVGAAPNAIDSMTIAATLANAGPQTGQGNIRQNEILRLRTDGADRTELFLTGFTFSTPPAPGDRYELFVAGTAPTRFKKP